MKKHLAAALCLLFWSCSSKTEKIPAQKTPDKPSRREITAALQPPYGLKWGDNQRTFRKAMESRGGLHFVGEGEFLQYQGVKTGGDFCDVYAHFFENKLYSVEIATEIIYYDDTKNALSGKYGPANDSSSFSLLWHNKDGLISMPNKFPDSPKPFKVRYESLKIYAEMAKADSVKLRNEL